MDIIKKVKKQPTKWKKISANHTSDKGLVPRIHKNTYNSIIKKQTKKQEQQW